MMYVASRSLTYSVAQKSEDSLLFDCLRLHQIASFLLIKLSNIGLILFLSVSDKKNKNWITFWTTLYVAGMLASLLNS